MLRVFILLIALCVPMLALSNSDTSEYNAWAKSLWDSVDKKHGDITLDKAGATLSVPDDFFYLDPADTEKILVELWGNPPSDPTLGMLFPVQESDTHGSDWGAVIEYEADGYVSDKDAHKIDYDDLLHDMQKDVAESSKERVRMGYDPIQLIGWASPPYYDATNKKLHWAQEIKFGDDDLHTLNYNIRILGRKGVLVLNFIADMEQKDIIDSNIDSVLAMAEFSEGSRYSDFNPDFDKVAAYGIGGLIAGKVLAKTGLIALLLVFLKKFGVFVLIGLGALFKGLFSRK